MERYDFGDRDNKTNTQSPSVSQRINQNQLTEKTSFKMEPTPIDPMLDEKANQLESEMHQQDTLIRSLIENLKHVERSQIPSITSSIQNIRNSLERILSSELPNAVKPVEDDVSRVKQKFEKFSSETQTKIQSFHEKLDDISISLQQSITRYNDLTSFTQTSVTNIETDLQHSKEALDNASKRLHLLESNLSKADSVLRSLKSDVQNLSKAFSDKLSQFVNECTNSFNNVSSRLNSALKSEAIVRSKSIYQVQQQIQEVIKNATDSTTKIQNFITTLRNQYQQVLTSLTRASKEGLTTCSTTYTNNFKEIDDRINQFISDSNKQFKQLESDISSTIQALHQYIITARQELETTISNISNSRINSETEIVERYDQLKTNITNQLKSQTDYMENIINKTIEENEEKCKNEIINIKNEIKNINNQFDKINEIENHLQIIIDNAKNTYEQLTQQATALNTKYINLLNDLDNVNAQFKQKKNEIEMKFEEIENDEKNTNYTTKYQLDEVVKRTEELFDTKMNEIEKQITEIFRSITKLTLNNGT